MKKFLSTAYSDNAFNLATLLLRLTFGLIICIHHGFPKLMHFSNQAAIFCPRAGNSMMTPARKMRNPMLAR